MRKVSSYNHLCSGFSSYISGKTIFSIIPAIEQNGYQVTETIDKGATISRDITNAVFSFVVKHLELGLSWPTLYS